MMMLTWQTTQWEQLWHAKIKHQLPHALLFTGVEGIGKSQFAAQFSQALLCQQSTKESYYCDHCHACRLVSGRAHPNLLWIQPEKEGQAIKVDQIRTILEFTQHSSWQGNERIVIIHPAHAMNMNAANALLKTLEEPASGSLIILISHQASQLPATILSRCRRVPFVRPAKEKALTWLKQSLNDTTEEELLFLLRLAQGAPLKARAFKENNLHLHRQVLLNALYALTQKQGDPVTWAAKLQEIDLIHLLEMIFVWMMDLIGLKLGKDLDQIINQDVIQQLTLVSQCTTLSANIQFLDYIQTLRRQIEAEIRLNKLLLIENILIRWMGNKQSID